MKKVEVPKIKSIGILPVRIQQEILRGESPSAAVCAFAVTNGVRRRIVWYAYVVRNEKHPVEGRRGDNHLVGLAVASRQKPKL